MACQKRNHRDSGELGRIESKTCTDKFSHPAVDSIGQQGPRKGGGVRAGRIKYLAARMLFAKAIYVGPTSLDVTTILNNIIL